MNILLTGAFGNVGTSTLLALAGRGHHVRAFDVRTPANEKTAAPFKNKVEVLWGDLTNPADVARAVSGVDVILHLAAIIPPLSERNPSLAEKVNIGGTQNLIAAAHAQSKPPNFVFTSSVSVHGAGPERTRPLQVTDPLLPSDQYSKQKVACESLVRASGLSFAILRLGAVIPMKGGEMDPFLFEIDFKTRVEFVHTHDVGLALANSADSQTVWGKTLFIGGGKTSQITLKALHAGMFNAIGIEPLPDNAFNSRPYYTDWMDTTESQALLHYQKHSFADFCRQYRDMIGWRRPLLMLFGPLIRRYILKQSPYLPGSKVKSTIPVMP